MSSAEIRSLRDILGGEINDILLEVAYKMYPSKETLNVREAARVIGCSHQAVHRAVTKKGVSFPVLKSDLIDIYTDCGIRFEPKRD